MPCQHFGFATGLLDGSAFHPNRGSSVQKAAIVSPDFVEAVIYRGHQVNRIAGSEITRHRQGSGQKLNPMQQTIADRDKSRDFIFHIFKEEIA